MLRTASYDLTKKDQGALRPLTLHAISGEHSSQLIEGPHSDLSVFVPRA